MIGIKTLTIGYTRDIELAEKVARATGATELLVETRPEGDTLTLSVNEQAEWRKRGWRLEGRTAKMTLMANLAKNQSADESEERKTGKSQSQHMSEGYSEGGRLKASMLFPTSSEGSSDAKDTLSSGQDDDSADDEGNEQSEQIDDDENIYRGLRERAMNAEMDEWAE